MTARSLWVRFVLPVRDPYGLNARIVDLGLNTIRAVVWVPGVHEASTTVTQELTFRRSDGRQLLPGGILGGWRIDLPSEMP